MRRLLARIRRRLLGFVRRPHHVRVGPAKAPRGFSPLSAEDQAVVDAFHQLYYRERVDGRETVLLRWLGWRVLKCPFDMWTYQEIIAETRPELIIECGTRYGGGALYMATLLDVMGGAGEVLTIDIDTAPKRPVHPRIRYLSGSTVDAGLFDQVRARAAGKRTMVILDSDHSAEQVRAELALYPDLVTPGCYLIVDDTDLGGNPVWPEFGPGPMAAMDEFLAVRGDDFTIDANRERFMLSLNPRGFLLRNG